MLSDREYLGFCEVIRERSHDPDRQIAAIIVDQDGAIVSEGTNAPPDVLGLSKFDSAQEIKN